ncbi:MULTISPECIES: amino acid adenylation domain-containing protein [unclassified Anabaena]|uniref:amino acid adenylation domain-containing protein n=1 Tax=unclassified Anabaena TaxID=2619674 RepID=UPI0039C5DD4D
MTTQNKNIESIYPLSPMQQGMLFHTLYTPNSGMYFEQLICTLHGNLNVAAFHQAWLRVVERHQVLRSLFVWEHGKQPLQVVCKSVKLPWLKLDWQEFSSDEQQRRLEAFLESERQQGFKLDQAPLMRCTLIQVQANTYQFVWSHHHLLMDGWCLSIILKEVLTFYETSVQGENFSLTPPTPYKDYISWLQKQDSSQSQAFWQKQLQGFTTPTPLITSQVKSHPANQGQTYTEQHLSLPKTLTQNLQTLAQEQHLTLNILVQGAWALLLGRYSGESDVLFGTTVSGRPSTLAGVESMVGLFINTLPIRVKVAPDTQLLLWLKELQAQLVELDQYSYTPLVDIQGWSDVPRGTSLFESLVVFENYPLDAALQKGNSSIEISNVRGFERTNYPLTVVVTPGAELSVQLKYDAYLFDVGTINQILRNFQTLLEEMVIKLQANLQELQLLTKAEQHQLLVEWNHTQTNYPQDKCIHQLFAQQVEKTPDAVAVVFAGQQLTYQELNNRANSLAHYLRSLGVGANELVGISVERSLEMVVGLLAILKAGGAYLPLDPTYPVERLSLMLEDAQARVLLTQQHLSQRLPNQGVTQVCLDADWDNIKEHSQENPVNNTNAENLAYVIYTSGSTGKPKGVMVPHRAVNRLVLNTDYVEITETDVIAQVSNCSFDAATFEIWGALLNGARLVIVSQDIVLSPQKFATCIQQEKLGVMFLTVALFNQVAKEVPFAFQSMRYVLFGGEAADPRWVKKVLENGAPENLYNAYGPTENTTFSTWYRVQDVSTQAATIPIGRAIANTQTYVLDKHLQPVPVGVPGELYLGGDGLALGYLHRPELNAAKFIPNPFGGSQYLYKTGDLVKYLPDGNIEFISRIDNLVKIRGFRIELGEITAALQQHPSVSDGLVLVREDQPGEKRLVAYIVLRESATTTVNELRQFLKAKLPEYMIPSAFIILEALPLNPNGKVDHRALPAPNANHLQDDQYQPPRTPTEEVVAAIWLEVLNSQVGVNVNFFEAGGHSLLATQVISRLQKAFAVELPLQYLFQYPTIAELSECIDQVRQGDNSLKLPAIAPVDRTEKLPLSFAQQRLWFLDQLEGGSSTYNVPAALELKGTLNPVALEQSLVAIAQRHEALRTTFPMVDGYPVQAIADDIKISLPVVDLQEQPYKVQQLILEAAAQPFDLAHGPLLRGMLLRLDAESHVLVLIMHHIICDGWSMGVFLSELSTLYGDSIKGQSPSLPQLPIQYADFAYWQHQYLTGEVMDTHLSYWKQQLAHLTTLELPSDRPRPAVQTFRGSRQDLTLPSDLSTEIKALSRREGTTLFMTLMAAFKTLLYCYANQNDIVVGTDVANRNRVETEGIIGFFVNQLVLRTDLSGNPSFRELLARVRQTTLAAYDHQDMPFDQLVATLNPERDLSRTPLFQSKFVLQNAPMPPLQLDDLTLNVVEIDDGTAKFDLLLTVWETESGLSGNLEYSTDLFNHATITRMLSDYQTILRTVVSQNNINLQAIKAILATAKEQDFQQVRRNKFKSFQLQSQKN